MNDAHFSKEWQAYDSLTKLMEEAQRVRELFDSTGLSLPEPLARLFGGSLSSGNDKGPPRPSLSFHIPRPEDSPPEIKNDWIWVPVEDLTPTGLLLGFLRPHPEFVPSKSVIEALRAIREGLNSGSIFNIAARLDGSSIERSGDGWRITDVALAPVLQGDYAWGPVSAFGKQELAAHRRLLIRHILAANDGGLQVMQLVNQLGNSGLCKTTVSKDLIGADLEWMQKKGQVRQRGSSRKWELSEKSEGKL